MMLSLLHCYLMMKWWQNQIRVYYIRSLVYPLMITVIVIAVMPHSLLMLWLTLERLILPTIQILVTWWITSYLLWVYFTCWVDVTMYFIYILKNLLSIEYIKRKIEYNPINIRLHLPKDMKMFWPSKYNKLLLEKLIYQHLS